MRDTLDILDHFNHHQKQAECLISVVSLLGDAPDEETLAVYHSILRDQLDGMSLAFNKLLEVK